MQNGENKLTINIKEITRMLENTFLEGKVSVTDPSGDGYHLEATVIYDGFSGKTPIQRHKMVYDALGNIVGNELHALALNTYTNKELEGHKADYISQSDSTPKKFDDEMLEKIDNVIKNNDVVLFMKGTKVSPMCGFSATTVHILSVLEINFLDIDVMADYKIRDKIKIYSNWPTIPQLYIKGVFVGGCDILKEMYLNKELFTLLKTLKIDFKEVIPESAK